MGDVSKYSTVMAYFDSCGTRFSSLIQSRRLLSAAHNASRMVKFCEYLFP